MKKNNFTKDIIIGAILLILTVLVPVIVRFAVRPMPYELINILSGEEIYADFFAYWRSVIIIIASIVIVFYLTSDYITTSDEKSDIKAFFLRPPVMASIIFLFFSLLSTLFSSYTRTSWLGGFERSEGMLAWFAYFTIFLAAMSFAKSLNHTKVIIFGLTFSSIIVGGIAFFQLIGRDIFRTEFILPIILGRDIAEYVNEIGVRFTIAHSTLYNPNTLGMYGAMMACILLFAGFFYSGKFFLRIPIILGGILMIVSVFASRSFAGFIGLVTGGIFGIFTLVLIFVIRKVKKAEKSIPWLKVGLAVVFFVAVLWSGFRFITPLREMFDHQMTRLVNEIGFERRVTINHEFNFDRITLSRESEVLYTIQLLMPREGLPNEDLVRVWDFEGNEIPVSHSGAENINFSFYVPDFGQQSVAYRVDHLIFRGIHYTWIPTGQLAGIGFGLYLINMEEQIPSFGFYNLEHWGSGRGFIWSRTFPLMPSRTVIGTGPDTYANAFPNHDLFGVRWSGAPIFTDKAHNILLHIWVSNGGIAALSFMFIIGFYIFTTYKSLIKYHESWSYTGLKIGLITGIFSFLVSSMSTDSTIPTTTVFFILLGMGYGLNSVSTRHF